MQGKKDSIKNKKLPLEIIVLFLIFLIVKHMDLATFFCGKCM